MPNGGQMESDRRIRGVTAAELEQMTPADQRETFDASIVTDLDRVPPEFLARVRARAEQIIAETESTDHA
jgi:hypothetical protein